MGSWGGLSGSAWGESVAKGHFSREKPSARRQIPVLLEAERENDFSAPPQMRRSCFPGFTLLCNAWGKRMRSLGSYFLLVAFSTPFFEAARAWSWTRLVPSLQE